MKVGIKYAFIFLSGSVLGGGITYQIIKKKFVLRLNKEMRTLKETFSKKQKKKIEVNLKSEGNSQKKTEDSRDGEKIDYTSFYKTTSKNTVEFNDKNPIPTKSVITPGEFETSEYEHRYCSYYKGDNILADEDDNLIDVETHIGQSSLKRFGEYEKNVVYVKNDDEKAVYEVTCDERLFAEVVGTTDVDEED